jgi:hypothetical protein
MFFIISERRREGIKMNKNLKEKNNVNKCCSSLINMVHC